MGIKDETPDDKVIFDSVDARMKYSKGIQKEVKTCENCYNKKTNPNKYPCNNCLNSVDNDLPFWESNMIYVEGTAIIPGPKTEGIKNDIVKTESELDIKLNKIEHMLKDISYNLELLGDEIGKIEERLGI